MSRLISAAAAIAIFGLLGSTGSQAANLPAGTAQAPAATAKQANQFASEADAKSRCGSDAVVWVNTKSRVYHLQGSPAFGHTKHGAFMCRADADNSGRYHIAKNEARVQGNAERIAPRSGSSMVR